MKGRHEEKVRANEIELQNAKTSVAEAEAYTDMVPKEEYNKEIERGNMKIQLT